MNYNTMGHKIFISYKYGDMSVKRLARTPLGERTIVRHYVDELQDRLDRTDHINKGELDGEDLSHFKDSTIKSKLRDKIYDSSVTVVLVSPNMKEVWRAEEEQWIPWEVSYSLREVTRGDRTSRMNGVLAVVLPDVNGRYDYMLEHNSCPLCQNGCTTWHTDKLFRILRDNMFNQYVKTKSDCRMARNIYLGYASYIHMIKWEDFIVNVNFWVEEVEKLRGDKDFYDIRVNV